MATNRDDLKGYFNAGDRPTENQFAALIDNTVNVTDDKATNAQIDAGLADDKYVTVLGSKRSARKSITVNTVVADINTGNIQLPPTEVPLTFGTGLSRSGNTITVNDSQVITKLSNLGTNGYVKTSGSNGTLSVISTIPSTDLSGTGLPPTITSSSLTSFGASPNIGAAVGTSVAVTGSITSSSGGIGYAAGNGGVVTQATSKATTVTLNKLAGDITLSGGSLAAGTIVSFTLNNSAIAATDIIHLQHQNTGTFGAYTLNGRTAGGSALISIRNNTAAALAEAVVIRFIVIKSVIS